MTEFLGRTGGGILRVDDTYADTIAGAPTTGEQTADVPAYYDGCAGSEPHGGCYEFSGLAGGGYQWAQEFDMLKTCGSVVAATCAAEGQEGSASFSWSVSPSPSPRKKKKKGHK